MDLANRVAANRDLRVAASVARRKSKQGNAAPEPNAQPEPQAALSEPIFFVVPGTPIGKPRQTQRDKWAKRPCVLRYREWADRARKAMKKAAGIDRLDTARKIVVMAYFPMPKSWSGKQRAEVRGTPHRQKPDGDNVIKSVCDSLVRKDETIYRKEIYKEWAIEGQERVEIFIVP